jgi:hypothetical protein
MSDNPDFHAVLRRFEERLPEWIARKSRALREPQARIWRLPTAGLLIAGGFLGFLPVLGFWMVPLGLMLLAVDLPALQPPLARMLCWIERKWPVASEGSSKNARCGLELDPDQVLQARTRSPPQAGSST